jgi:hypothetical protein
MRGVADDDPLEVARRWREAVYVTVGPSVEHRALPWLVKVLVCLVLAVPVLLLHVGCLIPRYIYQGIRGGDRRSR